MRSQLRHYRFPAGTLAVNAATRRCFCIWRHVGFVTTETTRADAAKALRDLRRKSKVRAIYI